MKTEGEDFYLRSSIRLHHIFSFDPTRQLLGSLPHMNF